MTLIDRIQTALANSGAMPGYRLAAKVGITPARLHKRAKEFIDGGHISREKRQESATRYYWYFLDEVQLKKIRLKGALAALSANPHGASLVTDTDDIHDRLKFLRMLKEKTVFSDHATLAEIIKDYERTLKLRMACIQRAESEEERVRPRKVDYRERRAA